MSITTRIDIDIYYKESKIKNDKNGEEKEKMKPMYINEDKITFRALNLKCMDYATRKHLKFNNNSNVMIHDIEFKRNDNIFSNYKVSGKARLIFHKANGDVYCSNVLYINGEGDTILNVSFSDNIITLISGNCYEFIDNDYICLDRHNYDKDMKDMIKNTLSRLFYLLVEETEKRLTIELNVFISQPMKGLPLAEIRNKREKLLIKLTEFMNSMDPYHTYHLNEIDSLQANAPEDYTPLDYISNDIKSIKDADIIVFAEGYKSARGCQIEDLVWRNYKLIDGDIGEDKLEEIIKANNKDWNTCREIIDKYKLIVQYFDNNTFYESLIF